MSSWQELTEAVRARAEQRCEYCRMHQALQGATFHLEHVTPESKGGLTELANLALACPSCNLHKSNRTTVVDAEEGQVSLYNPRSQQWIVHFRWRQFEVEGLTATGRATVAALDLNHPRRQRIRQAEESFGLFPPAS